MALPSDHQRGRREVRRALTEVVAAERLSIIATLIRTTGDWELAEDAVADAAERALERWPRDGIPGSARRRG